MEKNFELEDDLLKPLRTIFLKKIGYNAQINRDSEISQHM